MESTSYVLSFRMVFFPVVVVVELTHLVVKWSAVRNQSEIETSLKMRGMSPFFFLSNWFSRDAHKTMRNQPTGYYVDQAAGHLLGPRGQLGWGGLG